MWWGFLWHGGRVTVVCCLHTCQFSFQRCRVWQYLLLSPACQLRGGGGLGACRLRVTSPRKCRLEHRISQKGEYRCSCSEQFRAIAVQLLSKCQPSSTGTEPPPTHTHTFSPGCGKSMGCEGWGRGEMGALTPTKGSRKGTRKCLLLW